MVIIVNLHLTGLVILINWVYRLSATNTRTLGKIDHWQQLQDSFQYWKFIVTGRYHRQVHRLPLHYYPCNFITIVVEYLLLHIVTLAEAPVHLLANWYNSRGHLI